MSVLFGLVVIVAVVTLVGHGLWVLFRAMIRAIAPPSRGAAAAVTCPRCGEPCEQVGGTDWCKLCAWPFALDANRQGVVAGAVLSRLARQVDRYHEAGLLSTELRDRLVRDLKAAAPPTPEPDRAAAAPAAGSATAPVAATSAPLPTGPVTFAPRPQERAPEFVANARESREPAVTPAGPVVAPPKPSRGFGDLLKAFFEQQNIRWGELVGGLLIVGCSLALVISFWSSIAERPFLKFGLFNGVTAFLFAVGFHCERRWKLPTTALGLMIIATLLTPLNFLAVAALGRGAGASSFWMIGGEVAAAALFAALTYRAGRALVAGAPGALPLGVMIPSVALLLFRRWVTPGVDPFTLLALGATPLAAQGAAIGMLIARAGRGREYGEPVAASVFRLLGLTSFATLLALALLVSRGGPPAETVHRLAPLAPLAGAVLLVPGLLVWRRTTADDLTAYQTAGAAVAAAGTLVLLSGVALAWPDPAGVVPVALLNFAVLTALAVGLGVPAAHALAGACLALAYLLVWLAATGTLGWHVAGRKETFDALLSGRSGGALVPITLLFGAVAAAGTRFGRRPDGRAYALVGGLAGILSLGLVTWHGFGRPGDPTNAAWVYAIYAVAALIFAEWFGRFPLLSATDGANETSVLAWLGSTLLLAALVQRLAFRGGTFPADLSLVSALLAHATAAGAVSLVPVTARRRFLPTGPVTRTVLARSALGTSALAAAGLAVAVPFAGSSGLATRLGWLAAAWLLLAWRNVSPRLFAAFQAALAGSVVFGVATALERAGWYADSPHPWLDPWTVQAQGSALAVWCLAWIAARIGTRPFRGGLETSGDGASVWGLLDPRRLSFDRYVRGAVLAALVVLAVYGAGPGVIRELTPGVAPAPARLEFVGVPYTHAVDAGSWALLLLVVAVLLAGQWERFRRLDLLGSLLAVCTAAPLWAGRWDADVAVASALRWADAVVLLAASALIWERERLAAWAWRLGWRTDRDSGDIGVSAQLPSSGDRVLQDSHPGRLLASALVLVLTALPIVTMTVLAVGATLFGPTIAGPAAHSVFARLGAALSYTPPVLLVAAALAGYAVRERSPGFGLAAGLALNLAATAAYVLGVRPLPGPDLAVRLALLNAAVASASVILWVESVGFWRRRHGPAVDGNEGIGGRPLSALLALAVGLNLLVLTLTTLSVFTTAKVGPEHRTVAGAWGWVSVALTLGAAVAWRKGGGGRCAITPDGFGLAALALADFLAMGLALRDPVGWRTYRGLLAGQALAGGGLLLAAWYRHGLSLAAVPEAVRRAAVRWATAALAVVVLFALRAYGADPASPRWTVGGLAASVALAAILAAWSRRQGFLYIAGTLLNLAVTLGWVWSGPGRWSGLADLVNVNIIALALPAPLWMTVDLAYLRSGPSWRRGMPFGRVAAWVSLGALAFLVAVGLADDVAGGGGRPNVWIGGLAVASAAVAAGAGLWDARARGAVAGLYLVGLCASGWVVHQFHLPARWLVLTGTTVLSAYSLATAFLWSRRAALRGLADRLRIPRPESDDPLAGLAWLVPSTLALATLVVSLAFGTILTDPDALPRSLAAHTTPVEALAVGLLARGARRTRLQLVTLGVAVVGAVAWGWAWIAPGAPNGVLDRLVVVLVVMTGAAAVYGLGLVKMLRGENEWTAAARRLVPAVVALGALTLTFVLGVEVFDYAAGRRVPVSAPAVAAVALALLGATAAALVAAVVPGRDPLGLSERGRTAYVYGAEILLALTLMHVRLTLPWLFSGAFARYWPLGVLGVAFLGVGLGELFRRQGRTVLADPLGRTGAFLPVLPLLGAFWAPPGPGDQVLYLVLLGGLYTVLSVLRGSTGFGAVSALAFNAALWTVLGQWEGLGLRQHPQLWIIPPALCALVGAYLNRDRLTDAQAASVRYAASLAVYLSSTADVVLTGVAQAPWLPLVLAGLSIAGVFGGIMLRIRGFLFLGVGFLALSLFTVVWYAAVDLRQTWLWWASGIVAGVLILALFAVFEKKREDVLRVVGELKGWDA